MIPPSSEVGTVGDRNTETPVSLKSQLSELPSQNRYWLVSWYKEYDYIGYWVPSMYLKSLLRAREYSHYVWSQRSISLCTSVLLWVTVCFVIDSIGRSSSAVCHYMEIHTGYFLIGLRVVYQNIALKLIELEVIDGGEIALKIIRMNCYFLWIIIVKKMVKRENHISICIICIQPMKIIHIWVWI